MAEKKAINAVAAFFAFAVLSIAALGFMYVQNPRTPASDGPQDGPIVMFYGTTCPHCKVVEKYISDNGLGSRLNISLKEIYEHEGNKTELIAVGAKCGLGNDIGIPLIYAGGRCYVGEDDCMAVLKTKAGIP